MYLNLKCHIVSLVAVFLALGLGILIGTAVPGSDVLDSQQQRLAGDLERQLSVLRQKNEFLQARVGSLEMDNNIQRRFETQVLPVLLDGRLKGRNIAIIGTAAQRLPDELAGILETAGARIQSTTVLNGLEVGDGKELLRDLNWPDMDERTMTARIAGEIARAVLTGDNGVLNTLAARQVIRAGGGYGEPVDDVVIVGGSPEKRLIKVECLDYPIIDIFKARGVNVYGVEESGAAYSFMKEYQKKGIATVDNIDTAPGQLALVYAISGSPGNYGVKSSAGALLPDLNRVVPVNAR